MYTPERQARVRSFIATLVRRPLGVQGVLVPLAHASLLSGIVLSLGTTWDYFGTIGSS
jgi:hypothetical protein